MPGMLRRSSLVRIGASDKRQRMVPFQRPSITESMASMGQGEISFFETGTAASSLFVFTDNFVSTNLRVSISAMRV
jgi:hypothetical protein